VTAVENVTRDELMALVDERRDEVCSFLDWAERNESGDLSMYLANRPDIPDAREAAPSIRRSGGASLFSPVLAHSTVRG